MQVSALNIHPFKVTNQLIKVTTSKKSNTRTFKTTKNIKSINNLPKKINNNIIYYSADYISIFQPKFQDTHYSILFYQMVAQ